MRVLLDGGKTPLTPPKSAVPKYIDTSRHPHIIHAVLGEPRHTRNGLCADCRRRGLLVPQVLACQGHALLIGDRQDDSIESASYVVGLVCFMATAEGPGVTSSPDAVLGVSIADCDQASLDPQAGVECGITIE